MRDALTLDSRALMTGVVPTGPSPDDGIECAFCGERWTPGVIYRDGETLLDARLAARRHVDAAHDGPFRALLDQGRQVHGLSDVQVELLRLSHAGRSDSEIAQALGGRAQSTVRNHRFQLRRRRRQARVLEALLGLLDEGRAEAPRAPRSSDYVEFHPGLPVSDDRTQITHAEYEATLARFFVDEGRTELARFPKKEKHKLAVLRHVAGRLEADRRYTEKELNKELAPVYADHVTLRRYLVDYRFIDRDKAGAAYWRIDVPTEG